MRGSSTKLTVAAAVAAMAGAAMAAAGCTYRRTVKAPELAALRTPGQPGDVVLRTTEPWRARLSPGSKLRLRNREGAWTDWVEARTLRVDARGAYTDGTVPIALAATGAMVTGLHDRAVAALERTAPRPGLLSRDGERVRLVSSGRELRAWIDAFITEVARDHDRRVPARLCGPTREPAPGCSLGEYDVRARSHLRVAYGGRPLGTWRFAVRDRGWSAPLAGPALYEALLEHPTLVGWAWDDVAAAEVESLSGARSLGGVVGTVAIAAAMAPFAMLGSVARSSPHGSLASAGDGLDTTTTALARVASPGPTYEPGSWPPTAADRAGLQARRLFTGRASRRATARVVIAADVAAPLGRSIDRVADGVTLAARLGDLVELGGSVRHLAARGLERPAAWSSSTLVSAYLGGHFFFDAYQRVAAPLGIEAGGSGAGGYFRLRWGLRVRVRDDWFVGVYPLNPTFLGNDTSARALPHWSFPTALEAGLAF